MRKSRFTEDQMVKILREADKHPVADVAKKHGVSEQMRQRDSGRDSGHAPTQKFLSEFSEIRQCARLTVQAQWIELPATDGAQHAPSPQTHGSA